ncbi:MAG: alpha/beta hydrolase [Acidimicrobiales bacterium]|jgi:enterochelin esterase-like enzyme
MTGTEKLQWRTHAGGGHYGTLSPVEFTWALQLAGDTDQPRALQVLTDGRAFTAMTAEQSRLGAALRTPTVIADLVAQGDMPPCAVVYINPAHLVDSDGRAVYGHEERSYEYDSLSDQYVSFLLAEILPQVAAEVPLAGDPDLWAIGGLSSGAIASFTAAWHRPDRFGKVLSFIGSYVNIHGGHAYPSMIRKSSARPLRVYLQSGSGDLNNEHGSWPLANQQMAAALEFRGYDHHFEFGTGGHRTDDPSRLLPDALRWLWRGWPDSTSPWNPGDERTSAYVR